MEVLQHEDVFPRRCHFRNSVQRTPNNQRGGEAQRYLAGDGPMQMGMQPEQTSGMLLRDAEPVRRHLARGHLQKDVVGCARRRDVQSVEMEVRRLAEVVDQTNADLVTGRRLKQGPGDLTIERPEPGAAVGEIYPVVARDQLDVEASIDACQTCVPPR